LEGYVRDETTYDPEEDRRKIPKTARVSMEFQGVAFWFGGVAAAIACPSSGAIVADEFRIAIRTQWWVRRCGHFINLL